MALTQTIREEQRTQAIVNDGTLLIVVLMSVWIFSTPLRHSSSIMPFVEDDFYYYLKVAQSVAAGKDSTFNGIIRTNGYHPLYFLLLVLVSKFAHSLVGVFQGLWLIWVVAATATFILARKLFHRQGSGPFVTNGVALLFLVPCIHLFCQGMEVTLTVPLGLGLLQAFRTKAALWSFGRAVWTGLLAAVVVLSRLDSVFLVLLLLGFTLAEPKLRRGLGIRQISGFTLGSVPLLSAYFFFNRLYFHSWMPVSGMAKQLKSSLRPTATGIISGGLNSIALAVFVPYAVVMFWRAWKTLASEERPWLLAASCFPFVQIGVLSFVSDWPLWGWYFYSLRLALAAAIFLSLALVGTARLSSMPKVTKAFAFSLPLIFFLLTHYKKEPEMDHLYDVAKQIQGFANHHPGVYAMVGGAGMAAMLIKDPIIQTEGLVMNPYYLDHIRRQDDLLSTLHSYGVRYYVVWEVHKPFNFRSQRDGQCYLAEEPDDPTGPLTLHMRARLCGPAAADLTAGHSTTHIYDLR